MYGRTEPRLIVSASTQRRLDDADELPALRAFLFELDVPVRFREQRMITTDPNVDTRVKPSAALTNDDIPGRNGFTAINFTPRRLLSESRPFLLLPPAFL